MPIKTKTKKRERILLNDCWYALKSNGKPGVLLSRNDGWMTESAFFGMIRSALRLASKFWKPKLRHLEDVCRPYTGSNKRIKKEYQCSTCKNWQVRAKVEVNHKVPCGALVNYDDIKPFCERLFIEYGDGWEVLCLTCHQKETNNQRGV